MKFIKCPNEITLYTRAMCSWCIDAKAWLDEQRLKYTQIDVGADSAARQKASDLSGDTVVPVIVVDGHVLGDFDVDQLQEFLRKHGYLG
jgi:glutaredoxin